MIAKVSTGLYAYKLITSKKNALSMAISDREYY